MNNRTLKKLPKHTDKEKVAVRGEGAYLYAVIERDSSHSRTASVWLKKGGKFICLISRSWRLGVTDEAMYMGILHLLAHEEPAGLPTDDAYMGAIRYLQGKFRSPPPPPR